MEQEKLLRSAVIEGIINDLLDPDIRRIKEMGNELVNSNSLRCGNFQTVLRHGTEYIKHSDHHAPSPVPINKAHPTLVEPVERLMADRAALKLEEEKLRAYLSSVFMTSNDEDELKDFFPEQLHVHLEGYSQFFSYLPKVNNPSLRDHLLYSDRYKYLLHDRLAKNLLLR